MTPGQAALAVVGGLVALHFYGRGRLQDKDLPHRRNIEQGFYDHHGVFHPIRASKDYDEFRVEYNADERKHTGENSASQQLQRQFTKAIAKSQRTQRLQERLYELKSERDGLKSFLAQDGAAKYTGLLGKREFGLEYIPLQKARDLTGKRFSPVNITQRGAHKYVRAEHFFDLLSDEAGYRDDRALKAGIDDAIKTKRKVAQLGTEIADLTDELKRARSNRAAKSARRKAA